MSDTENSHQKAIIGNPQSRSFWIYDSKTGYDLTRPDSPYSTARKPHLRIKTRGDVVSISPSISALVIIDMQNRFLSPALGHSRTSRGLAAQEHLLNYAIPAARKAKIRIVWLNWGLTEEDLDTMPPSMCCMSGFEAVPAVEFEEHLSQIRQNNPKNNPGEFRSDAGKPPLGKKYKGLGSDMGTVRLDNCQMIPAGRMNMRDSWNTQLTPELHTAYEEGLTADPPDVWIHKNRISGLSGSRTMCTDFLEQEGIKTLLFAGVNTDQCVAGSMFDAFHRGFDVIMLADGTGTTGSQACQDVTEQNCRAFGGFVTTCQDFARGVDNMTEN